jgi:broad specificity phosphatase PhoE
MIAGLRSAAGFELAVVRHGQTAWNADGRFQGQSDIPLDATGRSQALALGAYLSNVAFAFAVASDLSRATETAQAILANRDVELERDPRWREMQFGAWEGLTWKEIVARNPELAERPANAPRFYTPQGGESFEAVGERVADAVASLAERASEGSRILVVTHAGPLHALLRVLLGESEAAALGVRFVPASVTRFALSPAGARIVDLNRSVTDSVA